MNRFSLDPFVPVPISEKFAPATRTHQGIPSMEILPSGRLFACWYSGPEPCEGPGNYIILATSSDGGRSWKEIQVVAPSDPRHERAFDSELWLDPLGRLWWLWAQGCCEKEWDIYDGRAGVWAAICDAPDTDNPAWGPARRIAEGVQMCKPTVLSDGSWGFPTASWRVYPEKVLPEYESIAFSNISITRDQGESFELIVGPDVPQRCFDEHMLVERRDGSWWVLVRTFYGIGQSFSFDRGRSWVDTGDSKLGGPCSRFAIRRLKSGRLVLINHQMPMQLPGEGIPRGVCREKLTAWLSDDDGKSWYGRLLIDGRSEVAYPDLVEGGDGFLYVIYDHSRINCHGQILMARFSEADIAAGELVTPGACLKLLVSAFPGKK